MIWLQNFPAGAPWDAADALRKIQAVFAEELVPAAENWPIGIVDVFDGSSFLKRGSKSVGVKRQWWGRLGKTENCQAGGFLNKRLYLSVSGSSTMSVVLVFNGHRARLWTLRYPLRDRMAEGQVGVQASG